MKAVLILSLLDNSKTNIIMGNFYKLNKSLGKYRALRTNGIVNIGFYAEFSDNGMDQYNDGSFDANIYSDGELVDIEINGWTFSFHIEGRYHLPGSYKSTSFCIEAVDPEGIETSIYSTPYYSYYREGDVLCSYLDLIHMYSHFKNADVAQKFYQLLRSVEGKHVTWRSVDSDIIKPEIGIAQAEFFKEFYEKNVDICKDKFFLKQIREAVNNAVDAFQEGIESYKIS
jgi:hypothetical protein